MIMNTRTALQTDIEDIYRLLYEFKGRSINEDVIFKEFSQHFISTENNSVLLIEDEDGVQGMAIVTLVHRLIDIECRVDYVFVRESARGKGYGKEIMKACDEWAWAHGADEVEFTSRPSREAANKLYQSAGYTLRETNVYRRKRGK